MDILDSLFGSEKPEEGGEWLPESKIILAGVLAVGFGYLVSKLKEKGVFDDLDLGGNSIDESGKVAAKSKPDKKKVEKTVNSVVKAKTGKSVERFAATDFDASRVNLATNGKKAIPVGYTMPKRATHDEAERRKVMGPVTKVARALNMYVHEQAKAMGKSPSDLFGSTYEFSVEGTNGRKYNAIAKTEHHTWTNSGMGTKKTKGSFAGVTVYMKEVG